jgi:hypothetical protein
MIEQRSTRTDYFQATKLLSMPEIYNFIDFYSVRNVWFGENIQYFFNHCSVVVATYTTNLNILKLYFLSKVCTNVLYVAHRIQQALFLCTALIV